MLTRARVLSSSVALVVASSLALSGCAADAGPTADGPTASTDEAVVKGKDVYLNSSGLSLVAVLYDFAHASVVVDGGAGTFSPSDPIKKLLYPDPSKVPADPNVHFSIPETTIDSGHWYEPDLHVSVSHFEQLDTPRAEINDTHVDLFASAKGSLHIHTAWPWPDGDFVVNRVDVNARFLVGAGGALSIDTVNVGIDGRVENCGAFGWCSALVNALAPDVSPTVAGAVKDALATELARPEAQSAWFGFLDAWANAWPDGGPAWHTDRTTLSVAGDEMHYVATRHQPPDPPVCSYVIACNDAVTLHCSGSWAQATAYDPDGTQPFVNAGWDPTTASMKFTWGGSAVSPYASQTAHACTWDTDGTTCIDIPIALPHKPCYVPIPRPIPIPLPRFGG